MKWFSFWSITNRLLIFCSLERGVCELDLCSAGTEEYVDRDLIYRSLYRYETITIITETLFSVSQFSVRWRDLCSVVVSEWLRAKKGGKYLLAKPYHANHYSDAVAG